MREITFRGKRIDNGEWVEGYFIKWQDGSTSIETGYLGMPIIDIIARVVIQELLSL